METINLISLHNEVLPSYDISDKEISFDVYSSPDEQVCIIGMIDNNYICWCSITTIQDIEVNAAVFDYVVNRPIRNVSSMYNVLGAEYTEVYEWHRLHIEKRQYNNQDYYYSPATQIYFQDSKSFALEIKQFYTQEKLKCDYRLLDNTYIILLETYKRLVHIDNPDPHYYYEMKPVFQILEDESYIKLSTDTEIRKLYADCMEGARILYNRYMNDAH
ncbi:hypothetical protein [Sporosarcina sp. A2]|uniref:hypothetical protein n=1 Tax=Sporosarcina sp. A2 TaxID=3393449 RepID=UPI003D79773D